jgi:hypothetical protein
MKLKLNQNRGVTYVIDEEADFIVGRFRQRYELIDEHGDLVAMIDDAEEAIPLLEANARANPPKWEREGRGYQKLTWFGVLLVEPATNGGWLAYRDLFPLLRNYGLAIFGSPSEAQAASDAHLYDGYPTAVTLNDNLLWSAQSVRPLEVGMTNLNLAAITIAGTLDGVLDPIAFPAELSDAEQNRIRRLAQVAVLERAVGITMVSVFLALTSATNRTKADLQQAAEAVAVELPRLVKLFRRCREHGLAFEATAKAQGKIQLRELSGDDDTPDHVLDGALELPLQFLMRWVHWDKKPELRAA